MSIFNPNYNLLNKYITEADNNDDDDDYSIDDKEFDVGDDESDAADKAADDLVNDNDSDESTESEADKAADDIVNDNDSDSDNESDSDDSKDEESSDDESDDNFDINLDGDDQGDGYTDNEGDENPDSESGSGDDAEGAGDSDSSDVTNELIGKEKDIFSDLTEDQMKIKVKELKESYTTLLSVLDDINSRVTGIPKNSNNIKILKFISSKLLDLKKIVNDYLINSFNTKTYIENVIFYQTSLAQLNTIKKVLEEMANKPENKDNKKAKK